MYPIEITNQFIELRSRDISLQRIADQLGINKSTAIDWQRRYQAQIDEFKAIHLDAVRERLTTRYEDELEYAMTELKRIRAELKTRDWDYEATTFLHHAEAAAYRRVQKLCALADFPRSSRDATPLPSPSSADGRAMCPHSAASPQSDINPSAPARVSVEQAAKPQTNSSKIQPFPNQNNGGSTSPAPCVETDSENPKSGIESSAPSRPCVEINEPRVETQNPSKIQPFPNHDNGGITSASASVEGEAPRRRESEIPNRQSDILNQQSLTDCASAPSRPCVETPRSEIENPNSKTEAPPQSETSNPKSTTNGQSPLTTHDSSEADFSGESIPINSFESTREWLERQGIQVSKVPRGARIITAT